MRWDVEIALAQSIADYLNAALDADIVAASPVVAFFDPMSIDDANRFVVRVPNVSAMAESTGNFNAAVEIIAKSMWTQATISDDFTAHFNRVNWLRDVLMPADLVTRLTAHVPTGFSIEFVQPVRSFSTQAYTENVLVSEMTLNVNCFATT